MYKQSHMGVASFRLDQKEKVYTRNPVNLAPLYLNWVNIVNPEDFGA